MQDGMRLMEGGQRHRFNLACQAGPVPTGKLKTLASLSNCAYYKGVSKEATEE